MPEDVKFTFDGVVLAPPAEGPSPGNLMIDDAGTVLVQKIYETDGEVSVDLCSYDPEGKHRDWHKLAGRKVRITVEPVKPYHHGSKTQLTEAAYVHGESLRVYEEARSSAKRRFPAAAQTLIRRAALTVLKAAHCLAYAENCYHEEPVGTTNSDEDRA